MDSFDEINQAAAQVHRDRRRGEENAARLRAEKSARDSAVLERRRQDLAEAQALIMAFYDWAKRHQIPPDRPVDQLGRPARSLFRRSPADTQAWILARGSYPNPRAGEESQFGTQPALNRYWIGVDEGGAVRTSDESIFDPTEAAMRATPVPSWELPGRLREGIVEHVVRSEVPFD